MKIEEFKNITIAYIRRTGNYGFENKIFMENFKEYLREKELLDKSSVILGIALDNPAMTDKNKLRYDVGLIVNGNPDIVYLLSFIRCTEYQRGYILWKIKFLI